MLESYWILLQAVVFCASLLQAATGIGFGLIAAPMLLIVLDSGAAVQVTIILSLLIALVLAPSLYRHADKRLLRLLLIGTAVGLPVGLYVYLWLDLDLLKLLAGATVLLVALSAAGVIGARREPDTVSSSPSHDVIIGVVSGAMSTSLAMPGPVPAAWMARSEFTKDTIRATILVLFVFSYTAAIAMQAGLAGLAPETLTVAAILAPATLMGIVFGRILASRITERTFMRIIVTVLIATSLSLLINAGSALLES